MKKKSNWSKIKKNCVICDTIGHSTNDYSNISVIKEIFYEQANIMNSFKKLFVTIIIIHPTKIEVISLSWIVFVITISRLTWIIIKISGVTTDLFCISVIGHPRYMFLN